jgi:GDSL-like Lipase/Acylhydrolase family
MPPRGVRVAFVLLVLGEILVPGTSRAEPPQVAVSPLTAAFTYLGADADRTAGVRLWPQGTATFGVAGSPTVSFDVTTTEEEPVSFAVSVDGEPQVSHTVGCSCRVEVASGLSSPPHSIVVTNTSTPGLNSDGGPIGAIRIRSWLAETPRAFRRTRLAVPSPRVLQSGETMTLWMRNATTMQLRWAANGARLWVRLDDEFFNPLEVSAGGSGRVRTTMVAWGMSPGVRSVSVTVVSGTLDLRGVVLSRPAHGGKPELLGDTPPPDVPTMALYGDSIVGGQGSVGGDGFGQRLATALGMRISNQAVAGSSAGPPRGHRPPAAPAFDLGCYGRQRVGNVVATDPDAVVLAYGTNNMLPGPDYWGCDSDLADFRSAIESILSQLDEGLPGVPVYVGAILPTPRVTEETRSDWNQVLIDEAAQHGALYVDASSTLDISTDYVDDRHPNNRGHADIAAVWFEAIAAAAAGR